MKKGAGRGEMMMKKKHKTARREKKRQRKGEGQESREKAFASLHSPARGEKKKKQEEEEGRKKKESPVCNLKVYLIIIVLETVDDVKRAEKKREMKVSKRKERILRTTAIAL